MSLEESVKKMGEMAAGFVKNDDIVGLGSGSAVAAFVNALGNRIKNEDFLPENIKKNSYNDLDAHISSNRGYLKNLHVAQLIQSADISNQDKILHIGGMTGYVSTLLASLCKELIIIENEENLISKIEENMKIDNLDALCDALINVANSKGGPDNITVVVAEIGATGRASGSGRVT